MNVLDLMRRGLFFGLELVNGAGMREAQIARLAEATGTALAIPEQIVRKVTPEMRAYILAARTRYNEFEWLYPDGPRDQICVMFHLTRQQVAGVLAAETQSQTNGHGDPLGAPAPEAAAAPAAAPTAQPRRRSSGITEDPSTWPRRNGNEGQPRTKKYETDDTDRRIVIAVVRAGRYEELRKQIATIRNLSGQQVAGIVAAITSGNLSLEDDH